MKSSLSSDRKRTESSSTSSTLSNNNNNTSNKKEEEEQLNIKHSFPIQTFPYLLSILLRLFFCFTFGYIHPDEFFQNPSFVTTFLFFKENLKNFNFENVEKNLFLVNLNSTNYLQNSLQNNSLQYNLQSEDLNSFIVLENNLLTWEWFYKFPLRNIFTPIFTTGLPIGFVIFFVKFLENIFFIKDKTFTTFLLFYFPRIFLFLISLIQDYLVYKILIYFFKNYEKKIVNFLFFIYLFLPLNLLFITKTFTDGILCFFITIFIYFYKNGNFIKNNFINMSILGFLTSFGIFIRFNSFFFIFPFLFFIFYKKKSFSNFLIFCNFFILTSFLFILIDSIFYQRNELISQYNEYFTKNVTENVTENYYKSTFLYLNEFPIFIFLQNLLQQKFPNILQHVTQFCNDTIFVENILQKLPNLIITPLNTIIYNSKIENLQYHTLHFKSLHFFVNLPMMFGILYLFILFLLFYFLFKFILQKLQKKSQQLNEHQLTQQNVTKNNTKKDKKLFFIVMFLCSFLGIFILSLAPHQEPRYIIPSGLFLFLLFSYLYIKYFYNKNLKNNDIKGKWILKLIIIQGLFISIFFGVLHQRGVISSILNLPSLLQSQRQSRDFKENVTNVVVYHNTYYPPTYLLSYYLLNNEIKLLDLRSVNNVNIFNQFLLNQLKENNFIYLIGPKSKHDILLQKENLNDNNSLQYLNNHTEIKISRVEQYLHVNTENFPSFSRYFNYYFKEYNSNFSSLTTENVKLFIKCLLHYIKDTLTLEVLKIEK